MRANNTRTAVFDARWVLPAPSGIGVYARELALRLPGLLAADGWRFAFLVRPDAPRSFVDSLRALGPECTVVEVTAPPLSPKGMLFLPRLLRNLGADLFHAPNFVVPIASLRRGGGAKLRCVATIHDAIPLVVPDYAPASRTARMKPLFRMLLKAAATRADAVFSVSATSMLDIANALGLGMRDRARMRAVWNGVDPEFSEIGRNRPPPRSPDGRSPATLLYVGRMDPYKNVPMLVEAFAAARAESPLPLKLVIAGSTDERYPEAERLAKSLGVSDCIEFTGGVPFSRLLELYRTADLLVHPSRYEGFGLQIAEAFASGLPALCSDGGALPEIAGDAAAVEPLAGGATAWGRRIARLINDPEALARMQKAGLERAAEFSWDRAAAAIAEAYR